MELRAAMATASAPSDKAGKPHDVKEKANAAAATQAGSGSASTGKKATASGAHTDQGIAGALGKTAQGKSWDEDHHDAVEEASPQKGKKETISASHGGGVGAKKEPKSTHAEGKSGVDVRQGGDAASGDAMGASSPASTHRHASGKKEDHASDSVGATRKDRAASFGAQTDSERRDSLADKGPELAEGLGPHHTSVPPVTPTATTATHA